MKLAAVLFASTVLVFGHCPTAKAAPSCVAAANEAQDLRAANKLREARIALVTCARPTCNSVVRSGCEKWLKEVDEQQPTIVVRAVDARGRDVLGVRATIDDGPTELEGGAVPVDPGQHLVRAKARSGDVAERPVLVALGEKARVIELRFSVSLEQDGTHVESETVVREPERAGDKKADAPRSPPNNTVPLLLGAAGVVALGWFTYFEIVAQSNYSDLESNCYPKRCSAAQLDPVRTQFVVAGVSLAVSAIAFAAAALIYFTDGGAPSPTPRKPARGAGLRLEHGGLSF